MHQEAIKMQEGCEPMLQVGHACESACDVQPAHHADHAKCMHGGEHVQITAYQKVLQVASHKLHTFSNLALSSASRSAFF